MALPVENSMPDISTTWGDAYNVYISHFKVSVTRYTSNGLLKTTYENFNTKQEMIQWMRDHQGDHNIKRMTAQAVETHTFQWYNNDSFYNPSEESE